jgi:hypothetical protein
MADTLAQKNLQESVTLATGKSLAADIAALYKRHACWTWYDDYEWCEMESFIKDAEDPHGERKYGTVTPVNFIRIEAPAPVQPRARSLRARLRAKLKGRLDAKA